MSSNLMSPSPSPDAAARSASSVHSTTAIIVTCVLAVAAVAAAFAMSGCAATRADAAPLLAEREHSVTATASAEVNVTPDKARINVGVVTRGSDASAVQDENASKTDAVIAALTSNGIADKSIQTEFVNLYPTYDYQTDTITGYEMTTTLSVSDLDIANVGDIIQATVNAGATRIDGIRYYASTYDEAYDKALHQAIANSRTKAASMASAAGTNLGGIISITEGYQDTSSRYQYADYAISEDAANGAMSLKTMPGELTITAYVTATYAIG